MKTLAISGCGAVTELYYVPALRSLVESNEIGEIILFDPDPARAQELAEGLSAQVVPSFEALAACRADLVVIASPPFAHVRQAIAALDAGSDVLCEKPLASTAHELRTMIAAAQTAGRTLFAGHIRRYFPATRLVAGLLSVQFLGPLQSVTCFEGGPFTWPIRSPRYFSRELSGGGVFSDIGSHCVDLLVWWLGVPELVRYQDDSYGGVEANCIATLRYSSFDATVRLSRDWGRPNTYTFVGSRGWLEWEVNNTSRLRFGLTGQLEAEVSAGIPVSPYLLDDDGFVRAFADQIQAVLGHGSHAVKASDVLPAVSLIESCYAVRELIPAPWFSREEQQKLKGLYGMLQ